MNPYPYQKNKSHAVRRRVFAATLIVALAAAAIMAMPAREASAQALSEKNKLWVEYAKPAEKPNVDPQGTLALSQSIFRSLAQKMVPTVANIYTTTVIEQRGTPFGPFGEQHDLFRFFFEDFFRQHRGMPMPERESQSLGSGFVIHNSGYIVTNAHVIQRADKISVKLDEKTYGENNEFEAEVIGSDSMTDVALLKIKAPPKLQVAPLGDSDQLQVGDFVMAIGNPFGHGQTVTQGIVSALGRELGEVSPYTHFIQTDASINLGNSGGPLINIHGEVVGINTAIDARGAGIGFAAPINKAKEILASLKAQGKVSRGWIGIHVGPAVDDKWRQYFKVDHGIIVNDVVAGEPAEKANIQKNDVIVKFNKRDVKTPRDILTFVADVPVGQTVPVEIWRDGKTHTLNVTVSERQDVRAEATPPSRERPKEEEALTNLGLKVEGISEEARQQFQIPAEAKGVLVVGVAWNSPAHRAGLAEGDVIERVNGRPVDSPRAFVSRLNQIKSQTMMFNVIRRGRSIPILVER